ncbi:MAG: hypothetical protein WCC11_04690 [Gammaproteobacteria bacterium]
MTAAKSKKSKARGKKKIKKTTKKTKSKGWEVKATRGDVEIIIKRG